MLLSEASGQFVPNSTQQKAISGFKVEKVQWNAEQVESLASLWESHSRLRSISDLQVTEKDAVSSLIQGNYLCARERLEFSFAYTHEKEFSSSQYEDMIEDFSDLERIVKELFS
jgi:hypothetical protein